MAAFRDYYRLTKPGIIYGNLINATAGYFLAAHGVFSVGTYLSVMAGSALVVGSGCVFNNYLDRNIDKKMARTKKRALVDGTISVPSALWFASILGVIGFGILIGFTNLLTVLVGLVGYVFYILIYGYYKRRSVHSTLIGSIAGAIPPLAGYTAAADTLDSGAALIFIILALWQMAHFYAIAIYRRDEYAAAEIPLLTVVRGKRPAQIQIMIYIVAFTIAAVLLSVQGYTSTAFAAAMILVGAYWFFKGLQNFNDLNQDRWGRKMFGQSLLVVLALAVCISADSIFLS